MAGRVDKDLFQTDEGKSMAGTDEAADLDFEGCHSASRRCRFGFACWRPDCRFKHERPQQRATGMVKYWTAVAASCRPSPDDVGATA